MFYRVIPTPRDIPDHYAYGYEDVFEFRKAIANLVRSYGDRIGECIGTRHAFCLLRFTDTPSRRPVTVWLPTFLLTPAAPPPSEDEDEEDRDPLAGVLGEGW